MHTRPVLIFITPVANCQFPAIIDPISSFRESGDKNNLPQLQRGASLSDEFDLSRGYAAARYTRAGSESKKKKK